MIRVLVVEDHGLVRAGLEALLGGLDDVVVVGAVPDGAAAVQVTAREQPDVALVDLHLPGMTGVEAIQRLLVASPATRVVVLTSFSDREEVASALAAGAVGYQLKDSEPGDLVRAIRAAARGEAPVDWRVAAVLLHPRTARSVGLTGRERDVLRLVAGGLANKQIARRLGISEKTVKTHLTSAYQRIGVTDRTSAALWAERNGLTADVR